MFLTCQTYFSIGIKVIVRSEL